MVQESPIEILKMRFVKGEITQEQYKEMLAVLTPPADSSTSADTPPAPAAAQDPPPGAASAKPPERDLFSGPFVFLYAAVVCGPLAILLLAAGVRDLMTYGLGFLAVVSGFQVWKDRAKLW